MILFPAIDLKGGACVRLVRGAMEAATIFNDDPAGQARAFAADGFEWLHVVDLDGAFAGRAVNAAAVAAIIAATALPIQLYESAGYIRWGTHPAYARVEGRTIPGFYYYKRLTPEGQEGADVSGGPELDRA